MRKIKLIKITPGIGAQDDTEEIKTVWADVGDVGITTKNSALMVGRKAELQAVIWRKEYENQTHAEVGGSRYRIEETGKAKDDLHVKLILAKGG